MSISIKKMIVSEVIHALTELQVGDPNRSEAWLMNVPNDSVGKKKINAVKLLFGTDYKMSLRGRHSDRKEALGAKYKPGQQNDIPISQAEYIGIYLYPKPQAVAEPESPEGGEEGDSTFQNPGASRNLSHPHPSLKEEFDRWTCMECHYQSPKRFTRCPKCSSQEVENLG